MTALFHDIDNDNPFVQAIQGYEETEREFFSSSSQCTDGHNCSSSRQTRLTDFGFKE